MAVRAGNANLQKRNVLKTIVFVDLPVHTGVILNQMTKSEERHIKNTSQMLLENGVGPTSGSIHFLVVPTQIHTLSYSSYTDPYTFW
jgi:hypothetical protein